MKPDDPAYWMLEEGLELGRGSEPHESFRDGCYICDDPEFAIMGLPLCWFCEKCHGHVPADDTVCSDCGHKHHIDLSEGDGIDYGNDSEPGRSNDG